MLERNTCMLEQSQGILSLPAEVIDGLARYLNARDTLSVAQTCKALFFGTTISNPGLVDLAKQKKKKQLSNVVPLNQQRFGIWDDKLLQYAQENKNASLAVRLF
jgi:hypothetical protein